MAFEIAWVPLVATTPPVEVNLVVFDDSTVSRPSPENKVAVFSAYAQKVYYL